MTVDSKKSVHLDYDMGLRPYHIVMTNMVKKYAKSNSKILDVGCGVGNMLENIYKNDNTHDLYGSDIDPICLNITQDRIAHVKAIKINDVIDLFDKSVLNEKFDIITMSHVLEHVTRPYDTVNGLMDMLNPGGHLILAVPNPVRLDVFLFSLFRRYTVNKGHVQTWDRAHWRNFLEVILDLNVIEYPTDFIRIPKIDQLKITQPLLMGLAKIFPGWARSCMAVIQK